MAMEEIVRLSFSNFPFQETSSPTPKSSPSRSDPLFEFAAGAGVDASGSGDVIFCGKIIGQDQDELNEYEKRDYFANIKSQSLRRPDRASGRLSGDLDYHSQSQRVNITSLTTMSSKSRRRMFMFGPVKFEPEMELGDIKRRKKSARRLQPEKRAMANELEIVQPSLKGRSYLASFLAKSFSCI